MRCPSVDVVDRGAVAMDLIARYGLRHSHWHSCCGEDDGRWRGDAPVSALKTAAAVYDEGGLGNSSGERGHTELRIGVRRRRCVAVLKGRGWCRGRSAKALHETR